MALVRLEDIIHRVNTKEDKDHTDLVYYVGGEHIDSESIRVTKRGVIKGSTIGPMFYYGFKAGDFLLVSRNPHLRKAGVVDFDGICSEKTFVLSTVDEQVLLPEYLPFVLQNERFWEYAFQHRHGSTNTFINWSTLANYEFDLPDLNTQRKLARVLWSINDTMDAYKKLITATDGLVKSQFIEMFGSVHNAHPKFPIMRICDFTNVMTGATPSRKVTKYYGGNIPWVKTGEIERIHIYDAEESITENAIRDTNCKILPENTIMIAMYGQGKTRGQAGILHVPAATNQACAAILPTDKLNPVFLLHYLINEYEPLRDMGRGAQQANLNLSMIKNYPIMVAPLPLQEQFATFVQQSDKSKFELEQALSELTATYKRIINENLG